MKEALDSIAAEFYDLIGAMATISTTVIPQVVTGFSLMISILNALSPLIAGVIAGFAIIAF